MIVTFVTHLWDTIHVVLPNTSMASKEPNSSLTSWNYVTNLTFVSLHNCIKRGYIFMIGFHLNPVVRLTTITGKIIFSSCVAHHICNSFTGIVPVFPNTSMDSKEASSYLTSCYRPSICKPLQQHQGWLNFHEWPHYR